MKSFLLYNRLTRAIKILKSVIKKAPRFFYLKILDALLTVAVFTTSLLLPKFLLEMLRAEDCISFVAILIVSISIELLVVLVRSLITPTLSSLEEELKSSVMTDFLNASLSLNMDYFASEKAYDTYTMIFEHSCSIYTESISILSQTVAVILEFMIITFILSWMNPVALIFLLLVAIVQSQLSNKTKRRKYAYYQKRAGHSKKLNYIYRLFWSPEHMTDLRANPLSNTIFSHKKNITDTIVSETYALSKDIGKQNAAHACITSFETFFVTAYFGYMVLTNVIWFDMFVVSQNSYSRLKKCISQIQEIYSRFYENDFYIKDYLEFIELKSNYRTGNLEIDESGINSVVFDNVSFKYPNSCTYAIRSTSFSINRGDRVFISGKNGTGKSTLVKLLLRLYEPSEGTILINGHNIKEYSVASLRKNIGTLFQSCPLYAFTIKDNLCYEGDYSNHEIEEALRKVDLWDKISQLPLKIDTPLTNQLYEGGIDFSGGERQRLALARMFLRKNSLLVFDEPTSHLDSEIEEQIFESIFASSESTAIIISHELHYAQFATKIIVLDSDMVTEVSPKKVVSD